ncbi:sporulation-induced protein, partial [Coemansia biformis]
MLWRFGLQHASNIDKLLDKEDLTLEEVLNDMDLMQEIREQNPKVISYLVQPHNMKQMVDYIATEEFFKFAKMASTAAEVLCSHSIAFADALVAEYVPRDLIDSDEESSDNEDRPPAASASAAAGPGSSSLSPPDAAAAIAEASPALPPPPRQRLLDQLWGIMRLSAGQVDAGQATLFSRVMCCLLQRKPYQTLDFIRAQDGAVAQFLEHLAMSPIVDLLLKVISLEELDSGPGVTAWLSERRLVPMLVDRMAPDWDPETHSLAAQVLLDIIAISQCNNPTQPTIGTNLLIAELKSEATVTRLADYMLDRTAANATSTLINCVYIFIELIRRNYSDAETAYAHQQSYDGTPDEFGQQPQHQQQPHQGSDDDDEEEEDVEEEDGVGGDDADEDQQASLIPPPPQQQQQQQLPRQLPTVDLSDMMRVLALRVGDLADLLKNPRSPTAPVPTTQGPCEPLGFERLRICELFAELLHCSNMPRLNAMPGSSGRDDAALQCDSPTAESGTTTPQLQQHYSTSAAADHDTTNTPVGQLLKWKLVEHAVLPECMDLFFRFPLNNFLHSVVYDIMHQ